MRRKYEKAVWLSQTAHLRDPGLQGYDTVYVGDEFCARHVMPAKEMAGILEGAAALGKRCVVVTPFETMSSWAGRERSLRRLARHHAGCEIVVNDVGLLRLIKEKYDAFSLTAGRYLVRQLAFPDLSILDKEGALSFLRACGIGRVEFSYRPGLSVSARPDSLDVSMHAPFFPISSTRFCPFGGKYRDAAGGSCAACREDLVAVRHPYVEDKIYVRGNTMFLRFPVSSAEMRRLPVSRWVFQPQGPGLKGLS